jgi:hypothetical protein
MSTAVAMRTLALCALFSASYAIAQSQGRPPMPTWEYQEVRLGSSSSLPTMNRLGAEGWELVSVVSACGSQYTHCEWWAYFKRRKS